MSKSFPTLTSRTTSSTTRIERSFHTFLIFPHLFFQNYIQHNKDWKSRSISFVNSASDFQNYIQHNKDWKIKGGLPTDWSLPPSRTTSSTTRIESLWKKFGWTVFFHFQNYIQHNKDWKWQLTLRIFAMTNFQNYIQHNKDWKWWRMRIIILIWMLPELHPAQQGLKDHFDLIFRECLFTSRTTSSTTRIESESKPLPCFQIGNFQNYIQHNKDWKLEKRKVVELTEKLPELHPAQQGLKD